MSGHPKHESGCLSKKDWNRIFPHSLLVHNITKDPNSEGSKYAIQIFVAHMGHLV